MSDNSFELQNQSNSSLPTAPSLNELSTSSINTSGTGIVELNILLEIPYVQWFAIKNDNRKLITEGKLQLIKTPSNIVKKIQKQNKLDQSNKNNGDMLILLFTDLNNYQYEVDKAFPIIRGSDRNYIFSSPKSFFGLVMDMRINPNVLQTFEELLIQYGKLKCSSKNLKIHDLPYDDSIEIGPPDVVAQVGNSIAKYIRQGTVILTKGIRRSGIFATESIRKGKDILKDKITTNEQPAEINPSIHNNLEKAKLAGTAVAKVSGAIVTGAVAAVNVLSNEISDSLSKTEVGKKLSSNEDAKIQAAKNIVKSSVASVVTIYDEVIQASLNIVRETSNATADIVEHKYGSDAGKAARSTSELIDNVAITAVNLNNLGTKTLARRIVANTTVDVLSSEEEKQSNRGNRIGIDPLTGLQVIAVASQVSNISQEVTNKNRLERQQFIGVIEGDNSQPPINNQFNSYYQNQQPPLQQQQQPLQQQQQQPLQQQPLQNQGFHLDVD